MADVLASGHGHTSDFLLFVLALLVAWVVVGALLLLTTGVAWPQFLSLGRNGSAKHAATAQRPKRGRRSSRRRRPKPPAHRRRRGTPRPW